MATKSLTVEIGRMLDDLRFCGFAVVNVGQRWRVTSPEGGLPVFIPAGNMSSKKDLDGIVRNLVAIGFTEELVLAKREEERQKRLAADKAAGERAMAAAARKAAATTTDPFRPPVAPLPTALGRTPGTRPDDKEIVTDIVELDLAMAKYLLEMNVFYTNQYTGTERNRTVSVEYVQTYAKRMLNGQWLMHNQGVGVDVNGVLVDGQKRLLAFVLACEGIVDAGEKIITLPEMKPEPELTIPIQITWNLPSESKYVVDKGEFRTIAHELGMAGEVQATLTAATAKLVILYDRGVDHTKWARTKVEVGEILEKLTEEPELRDAVRMGVQAGNLVISSAAGAGVHIALRAYPGAPMHDFLVGLKTGEGLFKGDPRLELREYLRRRNEVVRGQKRKADSAFHLALFLKAWNAFCQGKKTGVVRFKDDEAFPKPHTP